MINWSAVNNPQNQTRKHIIADWKYLLSSHNHEEAYHKFLADHSGFFFYETIQDTLVISKFKLGADFIADFVVCYDRGSYGFCYELIELEKPDVPLYTKSNRPSGRLVQAIQQIQDWRLWLLKNTGSLRNIFPSSRLDFDGFLNLTYTIIISKKNLNTEEEILQRNKLSKDIGISIRSFDYLTEKLQKSVFADFAFPLSENDSLTEEQINEYSNPFFKSYTDQEWRAVMNTRKFNRGHMILSNMEILLNNRSYNEKRVKQFLRTQKN